MLIKHTVQQYLTQLTTVKVCIQVASKLTKVAKVARKLCTTAKTVWSRENVKIAQKLHCARSQFSGGSNCYHLLSHTNRQKIINGHLPSWPSLSSSSNRLTRLLAFSIVQTAMSTELNPPAGLDDPKYPSTRTPTSWNNLCTTATHLTRIRNLLVLQRKVYDKNIG